VVQPYDEGNRILTFTTAEPLTCALPDPFAEELGGCDRYLVYVLIPEAKLVTGATLEAQVDGVVIMGLDAGPLHTPNGTTCSTSAGGLPLSARLELVDVSDTVTVRLTGFTPSFYEGQVDGVYTGGLCDPAPSP